MQLKSIDCGRQPFQLATSLATFQQNQDKKNLFNESIQFINN
jgi:hypothetical protein